MGLECVWFYLIMSTIYKCYYRLCQTFKIVTPKWERYVIVIVRSAI